MKSFVGVVCSLNLLIKLDTVCQLSTLLFLQQTGNKQNKLALESLTPSPSQTSLLFCLAGIPIKTTLDNTSTVQYAGLIHQLLMKARSTVRDIDPQNDLTFLRIRSKKNEIMIAPGKESKNGPCEC